VAICSGLEELLFIRLKGTEWHARSDLSSIFEQIQLSENLGECGSCSTKAVLMLFSAMKQADKTLLLQD